MEYTFKIEQLEILNRLIFDASISLEEIQEMRIVDSALEFIIERRQFEDVTRKKLFFWVRTILKGLTAKLCIDNIENLIVSGLTEENQHNHFICDASFNNEGQLEVSTINGLFLKMNVSEKTRITLKDIHESNFGSGIVWGQSGFTKEEWGAYLKSKNYTINA